MKYYLYKNDIEFILIEKEIVSYKKHNHSTMYVMGIVLTGTVDLWTVEKERSYRKNEYFIIPLLSMHAMRIEDKSTRLLIICIKAQFLEKENERGFDALMKGFHQILSTDVDGIKIVIENAYKALKSLHKRRISVSENLLIIQECILHEPQNTFSIEELAAQACFSKEYLIRKFKKDIGMPPHHYLLQNRIRQAQKLLQQEIPIVDVAAETGFYDQSHFLKIFRQVVGMTPKEYKNSVQVLE